MLTRPFFLILFLASPTLAVEASITLLTKDEAAAAIVEEKIEPYFKLMTPLEMAAKLRDELPGDTLDAKRDECRKRYAAAMKDFTDDEKAIVRVCIERVHPVLEKHYPLIARTPWSVIRKSDALEAGSHFTRESHVVLSEHALVRAAKLAAEGKQDAAVNALLPLLLHEQMHVLQRLNPKVFADLYTRAWGYEYAATIKPGAWLDQRQVVNPDGVDVNWVLPVKDEAGATKWMWPRIVLTKVEGVPVMFRDMQMILIELEKDAGGFRVKLADDGTPVSQPMTQSKPFLAAFPHGNAYHPNEAAAAALPAVILGDLRPENEDQKAAERKAYEEKLRGWMREKLK
jgi:hypothetical protein